MEMSSAAYATLSPTELDNFKNPLRLPGEGGRTPSDNFGQWSW